MAFKCKLCNLIFGKQIEVLEHYRLHHRNVSSVSPLPCPYDCCICTFQSLNALKIHSNFLRKFCKVEIKVQYFFALFVVVANHSMIKMSLVT